MGSLPSPPAPVPFPSQQERSPQYLILAAFCRKHESSDPYASNWIDCYNPSDNTWRQLGPIPAPPMDGLLKGFAMVAVRDYIFIIGGRVCKKKGAELEAAHHPQVDMPVLPNVMRYSVTREEWSQCAPMGTPRFDFACTVCDGKVYVAGGQCTLNGGGARGVASAEVYDPMLDQWTALPKMKALRYKCVGVTWQGRIYVVGGFAVRGDSDCKTVAFAVERSSAEVYDTGRGEWDLLPGMWRLDVPPNQIVAVQNRLYSSGDCLNAWKGHIEAYDGKLNIWNIVEGSQREDDDMCSGRLAADGEEDQEERPRSRLYLSMAPIGSHLYFLAGYRLLGGPISIVCAFDTCSPQPVPPASSSAWTRMQPTDEEDDKGLSAHCCVVQLS